MKKRKKLKEKWDGEPSLVSLSLLTFATLFTGTIFYSYVENLNLIDALYFSFITLTTIGYGDITPTGSISKIFTIFYVIIGLGIIFGFINLIAKRRRRI
ncbi:MAG: potassium channel family protein [Candidatus Pacearchaeota archaeon]